MRINEIEQYEILARAFRKMTGMMAPGKDVPPEAYGEPLERRQEAWRYWNHTHGRVISALLEAVSHVMADDEDLERCWRHTEEAVKLMRDSGADEREYVVYAVLSAGLSA